jgi:hypothetical protein
MIELRFIESLMSEKERIRKEANALIKEVVEKIVSDKFNFFENMMMRIEIMLAFEAI